MDNTESIVENNAPSKSKLPLFFAGVLILTLVFVIGYLLATKNQSIPKSTPLPIVSVTSNLDPTANWKTYTDEIYRFEVKYPGNLQAGICPNDSAGLSCANNAKVFIGPLGLNIVTDTDSEIDKNEAGFFFNGYFKGTKTKQLGFEGCSINDVKNSSFAISYVYCPNRPIFTAQIKGSGIEIYLLGSKWNGSILAGFTNQNQIDQILSTFKFLPSASPKQTGQPDETANWKTIISARCGFSIKYPLDFTAEETKLIPGTDDPQLNYGCIGLRAPDYKQYLDSSEGLNITVNKTKTGAIFNSITIDTPGDYIASRLNISNPPTQAENKKNKTYGYLNGIYYEVSFYTTTSNFVFQKNTDIFNISWTGNYEGSYKEKIDQILSTFRFD